MKPITTKSVPVALSEEVVEGSKGAVNTDITNNSTPPAIAAVGGLSAKNSNVAVQLVIYKRTLSKNNSNLEGVVLASPISHNS